MCSSRLVQRGGERHREVRCFRVVRRTGLILGVGALMLIGAVAGFIIVPEYKPVPAGTPFDFRGYTLTSQVAIGLSQTAYDALRITTWALVIVGVIVVLVGVIRYWRASGRTT